MMSERQYWHCRRREAEIAASLDAMVALNFGRPVHMPQGPAEPGYRSEEERARNARYKREAKARQKAAMT